MDLTRRLLLYLACAALLWACATQMAAAANCGRSASSENVMRKVNAARAYGMTCGGQKMPPAPPLAWNEALFSAAARHSADMARRNYFDHVSPDGKRVGARAAAEGYSWRAIGENIAGGDRTLDGAMEGWITSPGHCRNIMSPEYTEIGLACGERSGTTWGTYWTMVLGRRR